MTFNFLDASYDTKSIWCLNIYLAEIWLEKFFFSQDDQHSAACDTLCPQRKFDMSVELDVFLPQYPTVDWGSGYVMVLKNLDM